MDPSNRRQHSRYRCAWRARVTPRGGAAIQAQIYDISEAGVSILCDTKLRIGTRVAISLTTWDNFRAKTFAGDAIVRHIIFAVGGGYRVGLQFATLLEDSRRMLSHLLDRLANPDAES